MVPLALVAHPSAAAVQNTGRWTPSGTGVDWDWTHTPVHLVVMPGSATHHTRLLWWEEHGVTSFAGGMWGWNPGSNHDCQSAASTSFDALSMGTGNPAYNLFCAGQVQLGDKRVLIAGGTESGEIGVRDAVIFDPDASGSKWQALSDMSEARWYPTLTRLPSGKATVTSGSTYAMMHLYGGIPTGSGGLPDDSLRRMGLPQYGAWHAPVETMPAGTPTDAYGWPEKVTGSRFVWSETMRDDGTFYKRIHHLALLFGGDRSVAGEWISQYETRLFSANDQRGAPDEGYVWKKQQPAGVDAGLLRRAGHVLVSCPPPTDKSPGFDPGWLMFGGRQRVSGGGTAYLDDVWVLAHDTSASNPSAIRYRWRTKDQGLTIANPELAPSTKRYGAAGFYDPKHRRVLIYGGSDDGSSPVPNDSVYVLQVSATTDTVTWQRYLPTVASTGARPRPRFGHGMVFDNIGRRRYHVSNQSLDHYRGVMYGGRTASHTDSLSDQLWSLWTDPTDATKLEWRQVEMTGSEIPQGRAFHVFQKDDFSDRLLVWGGDALGTVDKRPTAIPMPLNGGHHPGAGYVWADKSAAEGGSNSWSPAPQRFGANGEADVSLTDAAAIVYAKPSFARHAERFGADGSGPTLLGNAVLRQEWYPFNFVLPDGSLFTCGPTQAPADSSFRNPNPEGDAAWLPYPSGANRIGFHPGSAAMYRPGRILVAGANDLHGGALATRESRWIPLDSTSATWTRSINLMRASRANHNLVILPNGQVMAVGGTEWVDDNLRPNKRPEIWDPLAYDADSSRYGLWSITANSESLAAQAQVRGYHSTAVLLPDGRILSAGGNNDHPGEHIAEIYCPPYLFNAIGNPAARPAFSTAPTEVTYGQTMRVCATHSGTAEAMTACLIAPGSTTHGFDQNQRYIPLTVTHVCGSAYDISTPSSANIAPPGYYLFFLLNNLGVPSVARWIKVHGGSPQTLPTCSDNCGGGCPMVDTRTADGWQYENTVLARSATGAFDFDAYRLKASPDIREGRIAVRLRENEQEVTTLDEVRLLAVDRPPGTTVFGAGANAIAGTRTPPFRATTNTGEDITARLSGDPGSGGWQGGPGDTVEVEFEPPAVARYGLTATQDAGGASGNGGDKEVELRWDPVAGGGRYGAESATVPAALTDATWLERTGIRVQVPDGVGGWEDHARWYPREQPDDEYFPALTHPRARLLFVGRHRIRHFGRLAPAAGGLSVRSLAPSLAVHSRLGGALDDVAPGGATTQLAPGDTVTLEFAVPPVPEGMVREYVIVTRGVYTSDLSQARLGPRGSELPRRFALLQNVPNPFAATTAVEFHVPRPGRVKLEVFDLMGRRVRTLTDGEWPAGAHRVEWDRRTDGGTLSRSGVYLYRMTADGFRDRKKLVIGAR